MGKQFFMPIDPVLLDRYSARNIRRDQHRRRPLELVRRLDLFTRSLQALPPRELHMVFQVKALNHGQDDLADLFLVRQSNISYRLARAVDRIRLFHQLREIASESALRRALIDAGVGPRDTTHVLMMLKTCTQKFIAKLFPNATGPRQTFERVKRVVAGHEPADPHRRAEHEQLLKTMDLVQQSWNRLTELEPQRRFAWKQNRSKPDVPVSPPKKRPTTGTLRRRSNFGYVGVSRDTSSGQYKAHHFRRGRRIYVGIYPDRHQGALAVNFAHELLAGPGAAPVNPIAPEHLPDEHTAGRISRPTSGTTWSRSGSWSPARNPPTPDRSPQQSVTAGHEPTDPRERTR